MRVIIFLLLALPLGLLAQESSRKNLIEGNKHYRLGEQEKAGQSYQKALQTDENNSKAWYNLGNVFIRHKIMKRQNNTIKKPFRKPITPS